MEKQEKVKWKKCIKCEGFIPDHWKKHDKCGWDDAQEHPIQLECAHLPKFCPDCGERLK